MSEIYEIHKTLCEGIDNKKKEDIDKVLNTICKVKTEKRKIATFDDASKKSGKASGLYIPDKEEKVFEEIKCDINRIGEVKDTIEEMNILKNMDELMECK